MRDIKRIYKILGLIEKKWKAYPDMRFCQLLINLGIMPDTLRLWILEDDDLLKHLKVFK